MRPGGKEDFARSLLFPRSLFERALTINEKALGPGNPSTAASLNYLEALPQPRKAGRRIGAISGSEPDARVPPGKVVGKESRTGSILLLCLPKTG
jgi:hypothetical protein